MAIIRQNRRTGIALFSLRTPDFTLNVVRLKCVVTATCTNLFFFNCVLFRYIFRLISNFGRVDLSHHHPVPKEYFVFLYYHITKLTNKNSIQEEIKSRFKLGNAAIIRYRIFCLPVSYPKS